MKPIPYTPLTGREILALRQTLPLVVLWLRRQRAIAAIKEAR